MLPPRTFFELFGKFGPVRYICQPYTTTFDILNTADSGLIVKYARGIANNTKGTAFVVYEDVMDAKQACDKLNGFNFQNRYLVGTSDPAHAEI